MPLYSSILGLLLLASHIRVERASSLSVLGRRYRIRVHRQFATDSRRWGGGFKYICRDWRRFSRSNVAIFVYQVRTARRLGRLLLSCQLVVVSCYDDDVSTLRLDQGLKRIHGIRESHKLSLFFLSIFYCSRVCAHVEWSPADPIVRVRGCRCAFLLFNHG